MAHCGSAVRAEWIRRHKAVVQKRGFFLHQDMSFPRARRRGSASKFMHDIGPAPSRDGDRQR